MVESYVDLYWLPVGAGTRFQRWSLVLYESVASRLGHRAPGRFYHAALKVSVDGGESTLELMPVPRGQREAAQMSGPVGVSMAGRLRLFRYQLLRSEGKPLPDEQWAVDSPVRLTTDPTVARRLLALAPSVPGYTWGRRAPGTSEMWTSDSAMSWLLVKSGIPAAEIALPRDGTAPGWRAGIQIARRVRAANHTARPAQVRRRAARYPTRFQ